MNRSNFETAKYAKYAKKQTSTAILTTDLTSDVWSLISLPIAVLCLLTSVFRPLSSAFRPPLTSDLCLLTSALHPYA